MIFANNVNVFSGAEDNPMFDGGNLSGTSKAVYVTIDMLDSLDSDLKEFTIQKKIMKMINTYNPDKQFVVAVEDTHGSWRMAKIRLAKR
jgi:hypothetical protein